MQLLGHEVSERIYVQGVLTSVGESSRDSNVKYVNISTPTGEFSARLLPDVDYSAFVGHSVSAGMRMVSPQFRKSKFERRWYCDALQESPAF